MHGKPKLGAFLCLPAVGAGAISPLSALAVGWWQGQPALGPGSASQSLEVGAGLKSPRHAFFLSVWVGD